MVLKQVKTKSERHAYLQFVSRLYKEDVGYVCTARFNAETLLFQKTDFAKRCLIEPVMVLKDNRVQAVSTYFYNPMQSYLAMGLFEAQEHAESAVRLLIEEAKRKAKQKGLTQIIIGLNGHLSYGTGILAEGFGQKISFDSAYNKNYYTDYLKPYANQTETLSAYRAPIQKLRPKLTKRAFCDLTVRQANLKYFTKETEIMRRLCDETLGKTFLYASTLPGHFTELVGGLKPFLKNENLLFAMSGSREIGFLFWHPDYNEMFAGGREYHLLQIFLKGRQAYKKAETFKLNAIGVLEGYPLAAAALISAAASFVSDNYQFAETNFVWDNNAASTAWNRRLFGEPFRKYEVYLIEV